MPRISVVLSEVTINMTLLHKVQTTASELVGKVRDVTDLQILVVLTLARDAGNNLETEVVQSLANAHDHSPVSSFSLR
jgi:hypothetical protein